jgi:hypothetical protein
MEISKLKEEFLLSHFQFQPWYIKLWRLRFYLLVPFWTFDVWLHSWNNAWKEPDIRERLSWEQSWQIAQGVAAFKARRLPLLTQEDISNHDKDIQSSKCCSSDCNGYSEKPKASRRKKTTKKKNVRSTKRK